MISGITSNIGMPSTTALSQTLSSDQTDKLNQILSNYTIEDLDADAATKIVTEIEEAGIGPGAGLVNALAENGIDARALVELAGVGGSDREGGPPPGGPPGGGAGAVSASGAASVDATVVSLFEEVASIYEANETGQTFAEILAERLEAEGLTYNQPLVDFRT